MSSESPWPYAIIDTTPEEVAIRRAVLDRYGTYAQLSAFVPVLAYQLYRLAVWISSERKRAKPAYDNIPGSPEVKKRRLERKSMITKVWRRLCWWLGSPMPIGLHETPEKIGHVLSGAAWFGWLLFLCIHGTGIDYLHVTKRFGVVAASQLPTLYMLAMKSPYSPFAIAFSSSHEQLNPFHQAAGRMINWLLGLHAVFYLNFFVQKGILLLRLTHLVVIIGIVAFSMLTLLMGTSLEGMRRWSYRLFYIVHLVVGVSLLPLLFFHAKPLRLYVVEACMVFLLDRIARRLDTVTAFTAITAVSDTNLLRLQIPIPMSKIRRFQAAPAQHVYLSIPKESVPNLSTGVSVHDILINPFTIADVTSTDITLVVRQEHGPTTTALRKLTKLSKAKPPIKIEGPYGDSPTFPDLTTFDRILLVAGGVGASFVMPIYNHTKALLVEENISTNKIQMVWTLRAAAETQWAQGASEDENIKVFLTGTRSDRPGLLEEGSVEMDDLQRDSRQQMVVSAGYKRPDLRKLVNETFAYGETERVAILACGPAGMGAELRQHVGRWVTKGRHVWYHNEAFAL